jgi:isoleucyl-tRNA synthetase
MHGEDMVISEEQYRHQVRGMMLILWNVYNFFVQNAVIDQWNPDEIVDSTNVLDQWLDSLLNKLVRDVTVALDSYDTVVAIEGIKSFTDNFSTWYLRRSRDRVGPAADDQEDKKAFYQTTHHALVIITQLLAPIAPFISESMYKNLTGNESVHLSDWPSSHETKIADALEKQMMHIRKIVELGHAVRKEHSLKVRQPLNELRIKNSELIFDEGLRSLLKDELNVKAVVFEKGEGELEVEFDLVLTPELEKEGLARDIIRRIQEERKTLGTSPTELIDVVLNDWPKEFESEIKRKTVARSIIQGDFSVKRIA